MGGLKPSSVESSDDDDELATQLMPSIPTTRMPSFPTIRTSGVTKLPINPTIPAVLLSEHGRHHTARTPMLLNPMTPMLYDASSAYIRNDSDIDIYQCTPTNFHDYVYVNEFESSIGNVNNSPRIFNLETKFGYLIPPKPSILYAVNELEQMAKVLSSDEIIADIFNC